MFQFFKCLMNRHIPAKGKDRWNGSMYVRFCQGCDGPIVRKGHSNRWIRKR